MAEVIILTAVINKVTDIAGNRLLQEGKRLHCLKPDIDWLQRHMRYIRSYIDEATARAECNPKVKNLVEDIQKLGGDVEDLLDEFVTQMEESDSCLNSACITSCGSFADDFDKAIGKIKERVAEIDSVRKTYNISDTSNNNYQQDYMTPHDRRRLFHYADETIIGLEDDVTMLQAKLLNRSQHGIISIVGMPGVGKTTLAKKLYRQVCNQFDFSAVVYVSEQPRLEEILLDVARQVGLSEEDRKHDLKDNLRSFLKEKRYVILMDDIWSSEIWDYLKLIILPECDSETGRKIIITSRNTEVARYIGGGDTALHTLEPLNLEKSIRLFNKSILSFDSNYWANASPNLENIGEEIVGKCYGIPLSIVLIAGILIRKDKTEHAWSRVLGTMGQNIQEQCRNVLALSFKGLPPKLRPCFLYFGLFPENYEIRAFDLINMWVAENFIEVSHGDSAEVEDTAEDILNDLVSRNMIQVSRKTSYGRIARCRIHDLLHSFCVTLAAEKDFFLTKNKTAGVPSSVATPRRLALYSGGVNDFFPSNHKSKKLRALLYFSEAKFTHAETHLNFKLLRVLVLHISKRQKDEVKIPKGIGSLSCLAYLKLQGQSLRGYMPQNIVKLKHLVTLDIRNTGLRVAFDAVDMKQLRHLLLSRYRYNPLINTLVCSSSFNAALLPDLQTLVGADGRYMKANWFHHWTSLRRLSLNANPKFIMEMFSTPEAVLPKLEVLKLWILEESPVAVQQRINFSSYDNLLKLSLMIKDMNIVNFGSLPANLINLTLSSGELDQFDIGCIKRLPKLKILKLRECRLKDEKVDLCGDNSFPQLEELQIVGWDEKMRLREVSIDELAAPKLNKIIFSNFFSGMFWLSERLEMLTIYVNNQ